MTLYIETLGRAAHVPVPEKVAQVKKDPTSSPEFEFSEKFKALMKDKGSRFCAARNAQRAEYVAGDLTALQLKALKALTRRGMSCADMNAETEGGFKNVSSFMHALQAKGYVKARFSKGRKVWTRTAKEVQE